MNRKSFIGLGLVLAVACGTASAAPLFDNFDSYADQAAFQAAWPSWIADGTSMNLVQGFGYSDSQCFSGVASANYKYRNARSLDSDLLGAVGTDASPIVWSFMLYDSDITQSTSGTAPARNFNEIRSYTNNTTLTNTGMPATSAGTGFALNGLIAMGIYQSASPGTQYAYRCYWGGVSNWFATGVARTEGWHEMKAVIGSTTVKIYVDGVLAPNGTQNLTTTPTKAFSGVVLGSGLTSNSYDVAFDDMSVTPEPATLLMLAAGGLFLRRRRA